MAILFDDCGFNFGGIKCLYVLTQLDSSKVYPYYPLDYFVSSADTSVMSTLNEYAIFEKLLISEASVVGEENKIDKLGKYFIQKFSITIPKVNIPSSQFLNSFLFKRNIVDNSLYARPINIDAYNTTIIFYDNNNQWWIAGYDAPFKITAFDINVNDSNEYKIELTSTSYSRIRKIEASWNCGYSQIQFN